MTKERSTKIVNPMTFARGFCAKARLNKSYSENALFL